MSESLSWNQDSEGLVLRYLKDPRPDLKDLIMVQYANVVERVARRFNGLERQEDLVQIGFVGLLNALSKFDPEAGVRFNTYANYLIAGEIKHYLRDRSQTIRQPAWLQELRTRVSRASTVLHQELGRAPSSREIADMLGVSETSVQEVITTQDMLKVASLDQPAPGDDEGIGESEKLEIIGSNKDQVSLEERMVLEQAMRQLRDLERQVLISFHFESLNQTEIAAKLGISCNYVSHILRQSLAKLRKILSQEEMAVLPKANKTPVDYEIMDAATGAYTESYFKSRLSEELHRSVAEDHQVALILLEFEGLDSLRQFYGDASVTDFLADACDFFKSHVRRLDVVSRFGETGFAIIFPETGPKVAVVRQRLLQRTLAWINGRYSANSTIRLRIGQSQSPKAGKTAESLIERALETYSEAVELETVAA